MTVFIKSQSFSLLILLAFVGISFSLSKLSACDNIKGPNCAVERNGWYGVVY
jgi:hypothetical protein